jgi:hypothetical protein
MKTMENGIVRDMRPDEIEEWESRQVKGADSVTVPQTLTNGQAREALLNAGLLHEIAPAIASIPDAAVRERVEIAWEYRPTVERNSPFVAYVAQVIPLTEAQVDQLFIDGAKL